MKYQIIFTFRIYSTSRGRDTSPPKEDENMILLNKKEDFHLNKSIFTFLYTYFLK